MDNIKGLTSLEVQEKIKKNQVNYNEEPKTKTTKEIFKSHIFTYFNFLNIVLGSLVLISGLISGQFLYSLKNCLFVGVILTNTVISIVEELLAKKTIDKLNVIDNKKITVIRDNKEELLDMEELVLDDICIYNIGNQIVADSKIISGNIEVNESFITGEEKVIEKKENDSLLSGSFIVSGKCYAKVIHVGKDNFVSKISKEAKYIKQTNSIIYNSFDKMLKVLSVCLIPVGVLFFINQIVITDYNIANSLMNTVSALIGMIPEGLILLTSSAMAVSVIKLKRYNVLVQELYAIENLARVDVICLDKTGTITEGIMEMKQIIPYSNINENTIKEILGNYVNNIDDNSITMQSIKKQIQPLNNYKYIDKISFSSIRKYSGIQFEEGIYYLGSPENLIGKEIKEIEQYQKEYRVLSLVKGKNKLGDIKKVEIIGFVLIQDKIKENVKETLNYFISAGVDVKIISGDNPKTVKTIAERAGLQNLKCLDFSKIDEEAEINELINDNNIFGRVKPEIKKKIIIALKKQGHFVAMTGDGVNDCLALKEADCSIAMANGSDAAKNVSQFVLLDSKIDNLPTILKEGRKSINNISRSSSLLLNKTIFTILLIMVCIFLSTEYFFIPIHLTLITMFTIGIPSFLLALESNNELVKGKFLFKIFLRSIPSSLTVVFNVVIITLFEKQFGLDSDLCKTLTVFLTATTGFIFLNNICKPYNMFRTILMSILLISFGYCAIFQYEFFNISYVNGDTLLIFIVLFICSLFIFDKLNNISKFILKRTNSI